LYFFQEKAHTSWRCWQRKGKLKRLSSVQCGRQVFGCIMKHCESMVKRCAWASAHPLMEAYHDQEWGVPVHDDRRHFEFLVLETMQAGLSWLIVLKKREALRQAFSGFNPEKVASYTKKQIAQLAQNEKIIRNRTKIESAVSNAQRFLEVAEAFGSFDAYCWRFVDGKPKQNDWKHTKEIPCTSPESDRWSRDLKKRGFVFVGPTIIYAHMQAVGMVNDHLVDCFRHKIIKQLGINKRKTESAN
jgi:DNA-3-methyladenine glycosylase I